MNTNKQCGLVDYPSGSSSENEEDMQTKSKNFNALKENNVMSNLSKLSSLSHPKELKKRRLSLSLPVDTPLDLTIKKKLIPQSSPTSKSIPNSFISSSIHSKNSSFLSSINIGQWLTHAYILVTNTSIASLFHELLNHLHRELPSNYQIQTSLTSSSSSNDHKPLGYHLSLTKAGIQLKRFQIQSFVDAVKQKVSLIPCFQIQLGKLSKLSNDAQTKTFFSLDVVSGIPKLVELLKAIDLVASNFGLPTFYECPKFHVSFAMCPFLRTEPSQSLSELFEPFRLSFLNTLIDITQIHIRIGHLEFTVNLRH